MKNITKIENFIRESLLMLTLITVWGAIVYRLWALNNLGIIIGLFLAIISYFTLNRLIRQVPSIKFRFPSLEIFKQNHQITVIKSLLPLIYFSLLAYSFYILFNAQTTRAIISPWQLVPGHFFILYIVLTLVLLALIINKHSWSLVFISLHYFLSLSVVIIVYRIGFGFDSFIHQATENLISQNGVVMPKPMYYLGQYSLVTILHKITFIPIIYLDRSLVPVLASIFLPSSLFILLNKWFKEKKAILLSVLILLILPFGYLSFTTPQNLAWLFLLLIIIRGLYCQHLRDLVLLYLLALSALACQPIAGIPAFFLVLFLTIFHSDKKNKKILYIILFVVMSLALPTAFFITEYLQSNGTSAIDAPLPPERSNEFTIPNKENVVLNFIYLYAFNLRYFIAIILIFGFLVYWKFKKECKIFKVYFLSALALIFSWLITQKIPFAFLINYERDNFTDRIFFSALLMLLPLIILLAFAASKKIFVQNKFIKYSWLFFLSLLIATSLYTSYPRWDHYHNSRGLSTSQNDLNAVRWIEQQTSEDYIVLANQQVSAAALREFGFAKYYKSPDTQHPTPDIFYYPIPTGSPLYQYFLNMVYDYPSRQNVLAAMDLTGVSEAYFVLNKYWWASEKIEREAKLEANSWASIDNGEVLVFKYIR